MNFLKSTSNCTLPPKFHSVLILLLLIFGIFFKLLEEHYHTQKFFKKLKLIGKKKKSLHYKNCNPNAHLHVLNCLRQFQVMAKDFIQVLPSH